MEMEVEVEVEKATVFKYVTRITRCITSKYMYIVLKKHIHHHRIYTKGEMTFAVITYNANHLTYNRVKVMLP